MNPPHPPPPDARTRDPHDPPRTSPSPPTTAETDQISGQPPVPITVWRTADPPPHPDDPDNTTPSGSRTVGRRLAERLVAAYSHPGQTIVDLTDGHALTDAAGRGRRHHRRAWFTDTGTLTIGPPTPPPDPVLAAGSPDSGEPTEPARWFGDDLTDEDLPDDLPDGQAPRHRGERGQVSLVVARWPLTGDGVPGSAAERVRTAWLLATCTRSLRERGCLVLVTAHAPAGPTIEPPADHQPLVAAAARTGLGYLQHIVALRAEPDGDRFTYYATSEELAALTAGGTAHLRVHTDLLVFTRTGGAP